MDGLWIKKRFCDRIDQPYRQMITQLMDTIGLRFKPALGSDPLTTLAILGNAITTALSSDPLPQAQNIQRLPTGPNNEPEDWTTSVIGVWLIVKSMVELDDDTLDETQRQL